MKFVMKLLETAEDQSGECGVEWHCDRCTLLLFLNLLTI